MEQISVLLDLALWLCSYERFGYERQAILQDKSCGCVVSGKAA